MALAEDASLDWVTRASAISLLSRSVVHPDADDAKALAHRLYAAATPDQQEAVWFRHEFEQGH
ncbi:MAG: hypothetical protein AAGE52_31560 [Myxococcota bacterium]